MRRALSLVPLVVLSVGCATAPKELEIAPADLAQPLINLHATLPNAPESAPLLSPKIYKPRNVRKGCPPEGDAKPESVKAVNILKNRITPPTDADIDPAVTLAAMAREGNDVNRWEEHRAASVVGFVRKVKAGGVETCNCHATAMEDRDTHIELVLHETSTAGTDVVVVEVTPRWRDFAAANNVDWSTARLRKEIEGKWVRVTGWLMYDLEHETNAENTEPGRASNWRRTAWEIHPVTRIDLVGKP